jgi:hypothetical protein
MEDFKRDFYTLGELGKGSFGSAFKIYKMEESKFQAMKRMPNMISEYNINQVPILKEL